MIELYRERQNCCGCSACFNVCSKNAITMSADREGFLYPQINMDLCNECGACIQVCSFKEEYDHSKNFEEPIVYAAKHTLEEVRLNSSSGGVFTAISDFILEQNGLIYGAAFDETFSVNHKRADTKIQRDDLKGSKYVQSDLKNTFQQIKIDLQDGQTVLFTGTPCQTAGLSGFLRNSNKERLYLCDIVCHGVPSPQVWQEYLLLLKKKFGEPIESINFRSKVFGWDKGALSISIAKKSYLKDWYSDRYYNLFHSCLTLRPSCHNCKFCNFQRPSDITIADFWGIDKTLPDFNDNKGVSLVLINTQKGKELFENGSNQLESRLSSTKDCLQKNLQSPSKLNPKRDEFWVDYHQKGLSFVLKKYTARSLKSKIKKTLYRFLK